MTTELWMLNAPTQARIATLARAFVVAHEAGDRDAYRTAIEKLNGVLEGYFLALGVEAPQEAINALRAAAVRQARTTA